MEFYQGIFIRDTLGDQGAIPSVTGNPTYSPDIICYQNDMLSVADAQVSYGKYICKSFMQDDVNNIYIRAKNNSNHTINGKVKAFYAPINVLYTPKFWTPLTTLWGDTEVSLTDGIYNGEGVAAGKICLGEKAFFLDGVKEPQKHHCMMGLVSNEDGSYITLRDDFKNDNGLWAFLKEHPQIAYNNINIVMPEKHTFAAPVQYGNYDAGERTFIFSIEIQEGLETLEGTELLVQSTNVKNPISLKETVTREKSCYSWEYKVPGRFFEYLDFAVVMPNYENVRASMHVRNYAANDEGDTMEPDVVLRYAREVADDTTENSTATQLGDFFLYLGKGVDHVKPVVYSERKPQSLPELVVTKRN